MTSALGLLRWTPSEFWGATMYEYTTAMKGYFVSKGVKLDGGTSRDEFLEMKGKEALVSGQTG